MKRLTSMTLLVLIAGACSADPESNNIGEMNSNTASNPDMSADSGEGQDDGLPDAGHDAGEDQDDGGPDLPVERLVYNDFEVRACRAQSDASVTIYAVHQAEPPGCALITFEEGEQGGVGVEVNDGWLARAASVSPDAECPGDIPGDVSSRARASAVSGTVELGFTPDGFPMGVTSADLELEIDQDLPLNPFGLAVLEIDASSLVVRVCPEEVD